MKYVEVRASDGVKRKAFQVEHLRGDASSEGQGL